MSTPEQDAPATYQLPFGGKMHLYSYIQHMKNQTRLYLIPTAIGPLDTPHKQVLEVLPQIEVFICERIRTTRRWLRSVIPDYDIDSRTFLEFDKHKKKYPLDEIEALWKQGKICSLTSEAGTPAVADPGYQVVAAAHRSNIPVVPMPGNNSLILGLMASGLNGNQFIYHGYFPIQDKEFQQMISQILPSIRQGYSQIFIETPYRNVKTMELLLRYLPDEAFLSVSSALGSEESRSHTQTIKDWKKMDYTYLNKIPAVYVIGSQEDYRSEKK